MANMAVDGQCVYTDAGQACQPWCMVEISFADAHAHCSLDQQCAGTATLTKCLLQPPEPLRSNAVRELTLQQTAQSDMRRLPPSKTIFDYMLVPCSSWDSCLTAVQPFLLSHCFLCIGSNLGADRVMCLQSLLSLELCLHPKGSHHVSCQRLPQLLFYGTKSSAAILWSSTSC